jgi:hypothetical protein
VGKGGEGKGAVQLLGLLEGAGVAEVEEIEDAVGVDAHGAVDAAAAPGVLGGAVGGGIRGGRGLGALPLPGIGDSRHLSVCASLGVTAATAEEKRRGVESRCPVSLPGKGGRGRARARP